MSNPGTREQGPTKAEIGWNLPFSWFDFNQLNAPRAATFISKLSGIINLILCNQGLKNCKIRQIGWKASFWTFKMGDCFYLGRLDAILSKESQLKQRFTSMKPMTWLKANSFYEGKLVVFLLCNKTQKGKLGVPMQGICPWCFILYYGLVDPATCKKGDWLHISLNCSLTSDFTTISDCSN